MSAHVVHHVPLSAETKSTTLRTGEGAVICVNQHVCFQILFLGEGLAARMNWAHEGVRSIVTMHVSSIAVQPCKFLAALVALKSSLFSVIDGFCAFLYGFCFEQLIDELFVHFSFHELFLAYQMAFAIFLSPIIMLDMCTLCIWRVRNRLTLRV